LLVVLLAEDGEVGAALDKELGNDGCNAVKEVGAELVFKVGFGRAFQNHCGGKIFAIHFFGLGRKDQMSAGRCELGHVACLIPRVAA